MTEVSADDTRRYAKTEASPYGILSRRLLILILSCSTLFTLIATALQLYLEYTNDVEKIHENVMFIESSYVPALARSLYELNEQQLGLQLNGALQLSDIVHLKVLETVRDGEERERSVGSENYASIARQEFELAVDVSGKHFPVGRLVVGSTTDNAARNLLSRAVQILIINATKTFIVALLILWIIQNVVTRHISDMSHWADGISLSRLFDEPFLLNRQSVVQDELQHVANALNDMRKRIATDITEREKLEAETRKLTLDLHHAEKLQAIGELAGGIAHDFNNQLHIILANADLLKEQFSESQEAVQFSDNIIKSCKNSSDLIDNLLKFSRKDVHEKATIGLNSILSEVSDLLKLGAGSEIKIILDLRADRDQISGDASLIQNAFLNIGLNARDALLHEGEIRFESDNIKLEKGTFATGPAETGWFIHASITDNGSGIKPGHLSRIFEPFFTTKAIGKGTGMGLAAVYGTVQSHNAIIEVSSARGEGTRFDVYFPLLETHV